jgi:hypothetical protein
MFSWTGASLIKHTDNFTFTFTFKSVSWINEEESINQSITTAKDLKAVVDYVQVVS